MKKYLKLLVWFSIVCVLSSISGFPTGVGAAPTNEPSAKIGTNFWTVVWGGGKFVPFTEAYYSVDFKDARERIEKGEDVNIWNPVFLEELRPYAHLRFTDFNGINVSDNKKSKWSERRLPGDNAQRDGREYAYEWQIDLCNRTGKDIWINIPHLADDEYVTELAKLIKETLNPTLKCYIEYSNETWNGNYTGQYNYCIDMAEELGLPGADNSIKGEAYNIYRSLQMFTLFENVFEEESSERLIKVCSISGMLEWFSFSYRDVARSREWNPDNQYADVLAIAPYVGGELSGDSPAIKEEMMAEIDKVYEKIIKAKEIADGFRLRLGTYEGGQHIVKKADLFSKNPVAYDCYTYMLEKFTPELEFFNHYNHCGTWGNGGAWGAIQKTGDGPETSPKYKALLDWMNDHPVYKTPAVFAPWPEWKDDIKVLKITKPANKKIKIASGTITGKTEAGAKVKLTGKKKSKTVQIASVKAKAKGSFKLKVRKKVLKSFAGKSLTLTVTKSGYYKRTLSLKVMKK